MAIPHFEALLLFSLLVSVAFAALGNGGAKDRAVYGLKVFAAFVGIALLLGWLMYPFPR